MSMFFNKGSVSIAAGKMKKLLCAAALTVFCIAQAAIGVSAEAKNEIKLEANGSEASLELYFPQAAAEGITSMQMSVRVRASSENVDLEFIPDSGLSSKIAESRYQSDTGTLNIYLAGTDALFSSYGAARVGIIRISTSGSSAASATVAVVRDSVRFVRSGELVSPDSDTDYPASVTVTAAGQSSSGTPEYPDHPAYPVYPNYTDYPAVNYFPNISVSNGDDSYQDDAYEMPEAFSNDGDSGYNADIGDDWYDDNELEEQDQIGENMNPPDKTALLEALSRAAEYREADYTESSYADLKEAVKKANKALSDPYATQDDIDEALLDIENAIGMLKLKNDIPSGAEGYGKNNDTDNASVNMGVFGENIDYSIRDDRHTNDGQSADTGGHDGSGSDAQAAQNGNIVNASDGGSAGNGLFSGNAKNGKVSVILIIVIAAAVVLAAAVIVLKKINDKKSVSGNHFKN